MHLTQYFRSSYIDEALFNENFELKFNSVALYHPPRRESCTIRESFHWYSPNYHLMQKKRRDRNERTVLLSGMKDTTIGAKPRHREVACQMFSCATTLRPQLVFGVIIILMVMNSILLTQLVHFLNIRTICVSVFLSAISLFISFLNSFEMTSSVKTLKKREKMVRMATRLPNKVDRMTLNKY